ncbi:MAG: DinB family protein [Phycisphaerales bacterium]
MPTTPSEPHLILFAHDRWANAKLYDACATLSHEQFTQTFPMGCGSIRNNLVHNLSATRGWTNVLNETPTHDWLVEDAYTLEQIRDMHDEIYDAFEAAALKRPFDTIIHRERNGQSYTFTVGSIITHVTTHAMHHRAQCLNMLRQLGFTELPMSSGMEWMLYAE